MTTWYKLTVVVESPSKLKTVCDTLNGEVHSLTYRPLVGDEIPVGVVSKALPTPNKSKSTPKPQSTPPAASLMQEPPGLTAAQKAVFAKAKTKALRKTSGAPRAVILSAMADGRVYSKRSLGKALAAWGWAATSINHYTTVLLNEGVIVRAKRAHYRLVLKKGQLEEA